MSRKTLGILIFGIAAFALGVVMLIDLIFNLSGTSTAADALFILSGSFSLIAGSLKSFVDEQTEDIRVNPHRKRISKYQLLTIRKLILLIHAIVPLTFSFAFFFLKQSEILRNHSMIMFLILGLLIYMTYISFMDYQLSRQLLKTENDVTKNDPTQF